MHACTCVYVVYSCRYRFFQFRFFERDERSAFPQAAKQRVTTAFVSNYQRIDLAIIPPISIRRNPQINRFVSKHERNLRNRISLTHIVNFNKK